MSHDLSLGVTYNKYCRGRGAGCALCKLHSLSTQGNVECYQKFSYGIPDSRCLQQSDGYHRFMWDARDDLMSHTKS